MFFFAAFAYVYFLRSKGLLNGLASGTNWVFRDESCHMGFAFEVVKTVREEEPDLFDEQMEAANRKAFKESLRLRRESALVMLQRRWRALVRRRRLDALRRARPHWQPGRIDAHR